MSKSEPSVPVQHGGAVDVCSDLSEDAFYSSTPVQGLSCPVSSSSGARRPPSRRSREKNDLYLTGEQRIWSEEKSLVGGNDFVDSSATMGHDARGGFRNQEAIHRRVTSPHSEGVSKRSNKPQMERRRRQRINESVNELRKCISEVFKVDPARHDKLEKADILEMTVRYFHYIQSKYNIIDRGTPNVEKKPVNFNLKNMSQDSYSHAGSKDFGFSDKCNSSYNEQPLTLIIQTISPNIPNQSSTKDPLVVGFNSSNSLGVQPASVLPTNPPVIQLNITNNISKPQGETSPTPFFPSGEKTFGCSMLPDTTTRDYHCDYSPSFPENSNPCPELPLNCEAYLSSSQCAFPEPNHLLYPHHLQQQSQCSSTGESFPNRILSQNACRPIAPKPPKCRQDNLPRQANDPHVNSRRHEQPEEVWRPWDANRKILKPHLVR